MASLIKKEVPNFPKLELIATTTTFIAMKATSSRSSLNRLDILLSSLVGKIEFSISKESGLGEIPIQVIIFDHSVAHSDFIKNKSIIFTQNGQVHGSEGQSFISQSLGFSLIKQHTLIHIDCTEIPTEIRQDLFMSNRTHLKQGPKTEKLIDEITSLLRKSKELRGRICTQTKTMI